MKKSTRTGLISLLVSTTSFYSAYKIDNYRKNTCENLRANHGIIRALELEEALPSFNPRHDEISQQVETLQNLLDNSNEFKEYHNLISQKEVENGIHSYYTLCTDFPTINVPIAVLATLGIFAAGIGINYFGGKYDKNI